MAVFGKELASDPEHGGLPSFESRPSDSHKSRHELPSADDDEELVIHTWQMYKCHTLVCSCLPCVASFFSLSYKCHTLRSWIILFSSENNKKGRVGVACVLFKPNKQTQESHRYLLWIKYNVAA
jgi:hypothetical protein